MPVVLADSPAPERQYTATSTNGTYAFTMHPTARDGASTTSPYGEAYRIASVGGLVGFEKELLWRTDGWYSFKTFISNDGRNLVRIGPWASLPQTEELAVAFYRDGIEQRRYVVSDLIENADAVERSVSHYNWEKRDSTFPRLLANGRFQLRTVENRTITFDVATGEILSDPASPDEPAPMPQVTREDADDQYHAVLLFRENGINIHEDSIRRVVRQPDKTIAWVGSKFAGLPVFHHELRYSFGADRKVDVPSGPGRERSRGEPLPPASSFPIDHRPDIEPDVATQTWLNRVRSEEFFGPDYQPSNDPEVTLGFHDLHIGGGGEPEYRLAWRVRPRGGRYPIAMVGAKKGDILFFDSGIRTGSVVAPEHTPDARRIIGASNCHDAVQGKIAWDYRGSKRWQDNNVQKLCAGVGESTEPARCFETAMHGDVDRGDGSPWTWKHAIELCSGTPDSDETLECFQRELSEGRRWPEAIGSCKSKLEPHMSASDSAPENERDAGPRGNYLAGRCRDSGEHGPIMANEKVCAAKRAEDADRQLAEFYAALHEDVKRDLTDAGAMDNAVQLQGLLDSLTSSQTSWTQYRDTTCRFAYFQYFPGSMAKLVEFECRKALADHRMQQLRNISTQTGEGIEY
jgi:uncharacterized protein YecT (DUF1311 family)